MKKFLSLFICLALFSCKNDNFQDLESGVYYYHNVNDSVEQKEFGYLEVIDDSIYIFDINNRKIYNSSDFKLIEHKKNNSIIFFNKSKFYLTKINEFNSINEYFLKSNKWYTNKLGELKIDSAFFKFNDNKFDLKCKYFDESEVTENVIDYRVKRIGKNMFVLGIPLWDDFFLLNRKKDSLYFLSYKEMKFNQFYLVKE